jgi:hypothetical protein
MQWQGSTILGCVKEFTSTIGDLYEVEYLRPPNESKVKHILEENEAEGFPSNVYVVLIACIRNGQRVQCPTMVSIEDTKGSPLSSLK